MSDDSLRSQLREVVFKYLDPKETRVFIFGSRATGKNRKYSDIDLGILPKSEISAATRLDLEEDFDQSNLPYRVDVVDFSKVSDNFKEVALKKVLYLN